MIDQQVDELVKPVQLPCEWKERALELASADNNVLDLRLHRRSLEGRRRRVVELYKDGVIENLYVDFKIGRAVELVPKGGFRAVFEGAACF